MGESGLGSTARLADTGPGLEERKLSARETAVMHELVTHCTPRPAATKHRFVAVQPLFADFTMTGLNGEQHRLPITASFPDTHGTGV